MKKIYFLWLACLAFTQSFAQWQKVSIEGFPPGIGLNKLYFDGNTAWAGTVGRIYHSTDNGSSWQEVSTGLQSGISGVSGFTKLGNRMYACFSGNGNYFTYYTTDNGANWNLDTAGWQGPAPVQLHTHKDYVLARLESNFILYKKNTDSAWGVLPIPQSHRTPGSLYSVGDTLFLGIANVAYTVDMGQSWNTRNTMPSWLPMGYFSGFYQNQTQPSTLYSSYFVLATNRPTVLKSVNNGITWDSISFNLDGPANISSLWASGNDAFVAFTGSFTPADTVKKVFRSSDGGNTWTNITGDLYSLAQFKFQSLYGLLPLDGKLYGAGLTIQGAAMAALPLDGPVGLAEFNTPKPSLFYPNPASHHLQIDPSVQQLSLFDMSGKMVLTTTEPNSLDVSSLSKGVYILKIDVQNQIQFHKLVKE